MASKDQKVQTQTNRLPAPVLFVGPPSLNVSNTSLQLPSNDSRGSAKPPLVRQRSILSPDTKRPLPPTITHNQYDGDRPGSVSANTARPFLRRQREQSKVADAEASSRAEAVWAEMQNTLEEVELSAGKGPGATIFGTEHSRALDALRTAQIELAKAWARSDPEGSEETTKDQDNVPAISAAGLMPQTRDRAASSASQAKDDKLFDRTQLEEETEKDIELSRKRREENDLYFQRVNAGVQDVVLKLEIVAKAMRGVESESKEIWGLDTDGGADTESLNTSPSVM